MNHREHARVTAANCDPDEDHGIRTSYVFVNLTSGGTQGFGGLFLGNLSDPNTTLVDAWREELLSLFQARALPEIIGRECFALYAFPRFGQTIEGLEVEGRRFTITGFGRKHWPEKTQTKLEMARERGIREVKHLTRRIQEETERLAKIDVEFRDWEKP